MSGPVNEGPKDAWPVAQLWEQVRDLQLALHDSEEELAGKSKAREEDRETSLRLFNALMDLREACPRCARPEEVCGQCGIIRDALGEDFT